MNKQTWLSILGAAFLLSAAPLMSGAAQPGAAQASTSTTKKKHTSSKSRRKSRAKGQAAPTPDRIKEIQTALQREGAYEGQPTGKWDEATADAMRKYQDKNGLNPTGKIDALSLEKLGLGSGTAGKGAPVPAATASTPTASAPSVVPAPSPSAAPSPASSSAPPAVDPPSK
jgi:peptidoglycan hydrolase-like protein with peptidoglycan-binding domain